MAKREPLAIGRWDGHSLRAAARIDQEAMLGLPDGSLVEIYAYRPRSDKQNRYLHAILNILAENSPGDWSSEAIKVAVKLKCGHVEGVLHRPDGSVKQILRSTSDFDREEMKEFIDHVIAYGLSVVAPGMDPDLLKREAEAAAKPHKERTPA